LLPLGLIRVGATKNIVDLLVGIGEVIIGILGVLLMIGRFGRLENLIYKTLESIVVSGLVLSLGLKNTNAIQKAFEFTRPGPVLLMMMRSFNHINRMVQLSLLVVALG
jgi:predicted benzoate:H+ symporter BenE